MHIFKRKNSFRRGHGKPGDEQNDINSREDIIIQSGVIPYIYIDGELKTALITSMRTKKWIFPKGFIDNGMTPAMSAAKEAMEEAGLHGEVSAVPAGFYDYRKNSQRFRVYLYPMKVKKIEGTWPEADTRERIILPVDELCNHLTDTEVLRIAEEFFVKLTGIK